MSTQALSAEQTIALECQQRRQANLAYFAGALPQIEQAFSAFKLEHLRLNINASGVDLIDDGRLRYDNDARLAAQVDMTLLSADVLKPSFGVGTYFDGQMYFPRFAFNRLRQFVANTGLKEEDFTHYRLGRKLPCVVVLGAGLGYHIDYLVRTYDVQHLIIVEPDPEVFAASLYTADWKNICEGHMNVAGRSVQFLIGQPNEEETFVQLWNLLIGYFPIYPVNTYFISHHQTEWAEKIRRRICSDAMALMNGLGNFDDELNQLVFALHNLYLHRTIIAPKDAGGFDQPLCIVGAGPSLDDRIEDIKKNRDKILLFSCGTALKSLHSHGLTPDFHVEQESDKLSQNILDGIGDPDYLKNVVVLAAAQVNPPVLDKFKRACIYFKVEGVVAEVLGAQVGRVSFVSPTVTNAAAGLAYALGFRNIYLFGCDYGFKDTSRHHAAGTIYHEDEHRYLWDDFNSGYLRVPGVDGGTVFCNGTFFLARRRMEYTAMRLASVGVKISNCSDGANIDHADWLSRTAFDDAISSLATIGSRPEVVDSVLARAEVGAPSLSPVAHIADGMREIARKLDKMLPLSIQSRDELAITSYTMTQVLLNYQSAGHVALPIVHGSLRHFNFVMYSHGYALEDEQQVVELYKRWRSTVMSFLIEGAEHFSKVVDGRPYGDLSDPWLQLSLMEEETPAIRVKGKKNKGKSRV